MTDFVDADVIIVGGGLAGLTAAYNILLRESSLSVIVLESTDRLGGRYYAVPLAVKDGTSISYFNLNAPWIREEQHHLLQLLEDFDVPLVSNSSEGQIIVECKGTHCIKFRKDLMKLLSVAEKMQLAMFILKIEVLCNNLKENKEVQVLQNLAGITFHDFIRNKIQSTVVQQVIDYIVLLNCGVSSSQISTLFYIYYCISTKGFVNQILTDDNNYRWRIKENADMLCDKIAYKIGRKDIFRKERVLKIVDCHDFIEVFTVMDHYRCYDVVVAVAPRDLLNIDFEPPLSKEKVDLIENTGTRVVTTFVATYPKKFWRDNGFTGEVYIFDNTFSSGPVDFCCDSGHSNPALMGRIFQKQLITNEEFPVYRNDVLDQLSEHFGPDALYPTDYYEKSWHENIGQMACWRIGTSSFITSTTGGNSSRIFWAGAENSPEWYGTLAGAVESGIRAALEVLYIRRPSLLTSEDMLILNPTINQRRPSRQYKSSFYSTLINWKHYVTVGLAIIFMIWRLKNKLN